MEIISQGVNSLQDSSKYILKALGIFTLSFTAGLPTVDQAGKLRAKFTNLVVSGGTIIKQITSLLPSGQSQWNSHNQALHRCDKGKFMAGFLKEICYGCYSSQETQ